MSNLITTLKDQLSDRVVAQLGKLLDADPSTVKTSFMSILPSIFKGVIDQGSTTDGAGKILEMIQDGNLTAGTVKNISRILRDKNKTNAFLAVGQDINTTLFGSSLNSVSQKSMLKEASAHKLMNFATPFILGKVGEIAKAQNLDAAGLQSYLQDQNSFLILLHQAINLERTTTGVTPNEKQGGSGLGFLKWLLPLAAIAALAWYFMQRDFPAEPVPVAKTETPTRVAQPKQAAPASDVEPTKTEEAVSTTTPPVTTTNSSSSETRVLAVNSYGNLIDKQGEIILPEGEFDEREGVYFDKEGRQIGISEISDQPPTEETVEDDASGFKKVFSGIFSKKEITEGSTYTMSDIIFNPESERIASFSKSEVEGLAQALQEFPDSKIQVQVHTDDGTSESDNKKLSRARAKVVHDMLVAQGVRNRQISFVGMGGKDEKAATDRVEIMVEK